MADSESNKVQSSSREGAGREDDSRIHRGGPSILTQHNTPPPTIIGQGSVTIDMRDDFDEVAGGGTGGAPKQYRIRPKGATGGSPNNTVVLEYIRLLNGNGETLYFDTGEDSQILIRLEDRSEIRVYGGPFYTIETGSDKRLDKSMGGNDQPPGHKRNFRFRHKDNGNHEFSIVYVEVRSPTSPFAVNVGNLDARDEFKIMIWPEDRRV